MKKLYEIGVYVKDKNNLSQYIGFVNKDGFFRLCSDIEEIHTTESLAEAKRNMQRFCEECESNVPSIFGAEIVVELLEEEWEGSEVQSYNTIERKCLCKPREERYRVASTVGNRGYRQWYIEDSSGAEHMSTDEVGNTTTYYDTEEEAKEVCDSLNEEG